MNELENKTNLLIINSNKETLQNIIVTNTPTTMSIYNGEPETTQKTYDAFNNFILSEDTRVFSKLIKKTELFLQVKDIPGDIVECGVFKGTGFVVFLKLLEMYCPNSIKRVIGFDYFNDSFVDELPDTDREHMKQVFTRISHELDHKYLYEKIKSFNLKTPFQFVPGDVSVTSQEFVQTNLGFRISLLYMDLDIEKPTIDVLNNFWSRMVSGGIIVFDEYAYHKWSESNAVDKFIKEKNLQLHFINNCKCPTAYIKVP